MQTDLPVLSHSWNSTVLMPACQSYARCKFDNTTAYVSHKDVHDHDTLHAGRYYSHYLQNSAYVALPSYGIERQLFWSSQILHVVLCKNKMWFRNPICKLKTDVHILWYYVHSLYFQLLPLSCVHTEQCKLHINNCLRFSVWQFLSYRRYRS